ECRCGLGRRYRTGTRRRFIRVGDDQFGSALGTGHRLADPRARDAQELVALIAAKLDRHARLGACLSPRVPRAPATLSSDSGWKPAPRVGIVIWCAGPYQTKRPNLTVPLSAP